jgi:4-aminobutyrate aminotransferase-like enzyme
MAGAPPHTADSHSPAPAAWGNHAPVLPELHTPIPGPRSRALAADLRRHESRNVTFTSEEWPIFWERAEGTNVWDADGNRFLDCTAAFGVASLGHARPELVEAMQRQAAKLMHAMGDVHPTPGKAELCAELSALTFERWGAGAGKVILGNSGFEAVEAALKTSLLYSGKPGVIAFTGAYHGLGFGALTAGGIPYFREPFRPQLKEFATFLPYPTCYRCPNGVREGYRLEGRDFPNCSTPCLEKLRAELDQTIRTRPIGAILVEPIQGRGGCIVPPRDFLRVLREVCDAHKVLLIADEILTGFNRTGSLFACDHFGVIPDVICVGKALTGGFPLSACVGRSDVMDAWPASRGEALHTSTFLGNPVGCELALASLRIHRSPEMARQVREVGAAFKSGLREIRSPKIGDVRGVGLMLGVEIVTSNGEPDGTTAIGLVQDALRNGILLLADSPHGNVLSFTPPFTISQEEIQHVLQWLGNALN